MINYFVSKERQHGVTLLEMMVTLAIAAILLMAVAPNVQSILTKNKVSAEINEVSGILQFARYTAIDEQTTAVVCPSSDFTNCSNDWNAAKMVFIDANANGARDSAEMLLLTSQPISSTNTMSASENSIRFLDSGGVQAAINITLCPKSKDATFSRALFVSLQGRTRISVDNNNDGIHEDSAGVNLSCL